MMCGDFFSMGDYAWYVWGSYGVFLAALALEIVLLRRRGRRAIKQAQESQPASTGARQHSLLTLGATDESAP